MMKLLGALALLMALALPAAATQQTINRGTPNDRSGDSVYVFTGKINANFAETYAAISTLTTALTGKAASIHTHVIGDVTGLQASLDARQPLNGLLTSIAGGAALPIANGGTGSTSASAARTALGAATRGANSDITSLTGLAVPISMAQGGTGAASFSDGLDAAFGAAQGNVLYRGASGWASLGPGSAGQMLTTGGTGANPSWTTPSTGSAATYVPVRQTALSGPASSGAPSFLPATTTGTLTLTAQNVSGSAALIYTAAQGFGASGAIDVIYRATSNPSWTLTASTTNYLFGNASTGATSVSTLAPAYIEGGTPSTTNGQFTFDKSAAGMMGYLGNGTTAPATPLVPLGEAVTSGTAVTSTVAYAYQGRWNSDIFAVATSSSVTRQHNLGVPAHLVTLESAFGAATTGPWAQPASGYYSTPYTFPAATVTDRLALTVTTGPNGFWVAGGSVAASGYGWVRAKRAW